MEKKPDNPSNNSSQPTIFGRSRVFLYVSLILLFALGIYFRLLNITNPPLDDNAWRQLASASYARGLYYQMLPDADPQKRQQAMNIAAETVHLEPTITEALVAVSYFVAGGEHLWIFRLWTTLFWVIGGIALFAFVRRMTSADGAFVALGYYLLLPFGNAITRQLLPEPLMVMWILLALYALSRWLDEQSWKWTILTGLFAGLALLTKIFSIFPLAPAIILASIATFGFRPIVKKLKFWTIGALAGIIPSVYYFFSLHNQEATIWEPGCCLI